MSENGFETMRLTAASVPVTAIRRVADQMRAANIPVNASSIVMYSIGRVAGIPDDKLIEFTLPKRGRKNDDFLRDLEDA